MTSAKYQRGDRPAEMLRIGAGKEHGGTMPLGNPLGREPCVGGLNC